MPPTRLGEHHAREVFEIDLVHDAGVRRDDFEVAERALAPAQERVAFAIARELELGIQRKGVGAPEVVHLHRVVDDELDRLQRVDAIGIAAEADDRVAHRREVDHAGDAGEVLQQDARGHEGDFLLRRRGGVPLRDRADVVRLHERVVLAPQQVLEQDLHRVRQPRDAGEAGLLERRKTVNLHRLSAAADLGACTETVQCSGHSPRSYSAVEFVVETRSRTTTARAVGSLRGCERQTRVVHPRACVGRGHAAASKTRDGAADFG